MLRVKKPQSHITILDTTNQWSNIMTAREVAIVHMHTQDPDKNMFDYKGRMILICPRPYKEDNIPVEVVYVNLIGDLVIENGVYRHVLRRGDHTGYSIEIKGPFRIGFEDLKKRFYFHYIKTENGRTWRCPTDDIELAWENSDPMPERS
jgi:hypothetical protein